MGSGTAEMLINLRLFAPELVLLALLVALFLTDGLMPKSRSGKLPLVLTVLACGLGGWVSVQAASLPSTGFFSGVVASDGLGAFFRCIFFFVCAVALCVAYSSREIEATARSEYAILIVTVTFGMSLMALATNLLVLYLGVETVSIVSFVLAGFGRDSMRSNEASLKYLVYGAASSALMIYGFSLIYGYTGSLFYPEIARQVAAMGQFPLGLSFAVLLAYAGLAFKLAAFPMHFWAPDVYEGAPTPVVTFFSVGPKAAGFAALIRLVIEVFSVRLSDGHWKAIDGSHLVVGLAAVSAITMTIGNLCAVGQTSAKRMLAYSSIAHVGYLLMGLVALDETGLLAILFYLVAYCAMNIGAFWIVGLVRDFRGTDEVEAFRGFGWSHPTVAICMSVFLFSLTGLPVFAGFIGKFLLFRAVWNAPGFLWLAVVGVLNSVVSLYYYSRFLRAMWFDPVVAPERGGSSQPRFPSVIPIPVVAALVALAVPTVVLGLYFEPILRVAKSSLENLLS